MEFLGLDFFFYLLRRRSVCSCKNLEGVVLSVQSESFLVRENRHGEHVPTARSVNVMYHPLQKFKSSLYLCLQNGPDETVYGLRQLE